MIPKIIPKFEPEIVQLLAKGHVDQHKVATTSIKALVVDGVRISSRYNRS